MGYYVSTVNKQVERKMSNANEALIETEKLVKNVKIVRDFISPAQLNAMANGVRSEERSHFVAKFEELPNTISTMAKTYEQDGKGDDAIVYLHYFLGGADWFITEKDMEDEQYQAFGLADLFNDGGELGYISIVELVQNGVELDLFWTPKTLREVKESRK
jgi:hypothetical protein